MFLAAPLCAQDALPEAPAHEGELLANPRQLTFEGRRAGEGYFSADGKKMIFQSEREADNPFYQIYLLDFESGETKRVSPGTGKTTCAWLHPDNQRVIFASTHEDAEAKAKQEAEFAERKSSKIRKYNWDYDQNYDIFAADLDGKNPVNLTKTPGYDAEGSLSPDGKRLVFASNRQAYRESLSDGEKKRLELDKAYFMEIHTMNADGTDVKRLTNVPGYDGGPFFSADGQRICWRRFTEKGDQAEIMVMDADGGNQRAVTRLGAMSWAPYFHPSGDYLIFTTNRHGFDNFELYLVDAKGEKEPVRVTGTAGFDGLPVFSPDGKKLSWTSGRTGNQSSQIFMADWNDGKARELLGSTLAVNAVPDLSANGVSGGTTPEISRDDAQKHVVYLASDKLQGRLTGTEGEKLATQYAADAFHSFGLQPAAPDGGWFQEFPFTSGVELGPKNSLTFNTATPKLDEEWRPLSLSLVGDIAESGIVFAGYGIEEPEKSLANKEQQAYSSYFHLDVKDKWVMVLRYLPEKAGKPLRERLVNYSSLRHKALTARQRGAKGLMVVSGPNSQVRSPLVPLGFDSSLAGSGIAAVSITDQLADAMLAASGKTIKQLQDELDKGESAAGFELAGITAKAAIDIKEEKRTGRNVIARLQATDPAASQRPPLVIGAHIDHLGNKLGSNSRGTDSEADKIHHGADDNASGVAAMLEIAQWMADQQNQGKLVLRRDVIFAGWSGEEIGLLGSAAWVRALAKAGGGDEDASLNGKVAAYLNMDMVGRLREKLVLQGLGSSSVWMKEIEKANVVAGLPLTTQSDAYLPTDATTFYVKGVPVFSAFTGSHEEYHTPRDTADKINYPGIESIAKFMGAVARSLAQREEAPDYREMEKPKEAGRGGLRLYLGTIPDYSQGDLEGVKLSGVAKLGPAQKAGVLAGDLIVELGGKPIKNLYDYTYLMSELKPGEETTVVVQRKEERLTLKITPVSRE